VQVFVSNDGDELTRKRLEVGERCRKMAQRGVVKLFNVARAVHIKREEGSRVAKSEGVVGMVNTKKKARLESLSQDRQNNQ